MKYLHRIGALGLAGALSISLFAGCGSSSSSQSGSSSSSQPDSSSSSETTKGGSYTMFMRSTYVDWINELKWYDEAVKKTGINVEYVKGPEEFADFYSEVDQRVISSTLPDATMTKLAQTNVYGPQGVFMDLAPKIKEYAPNLQKYIDNNPTYKALVTNDKGQIFGLVKETPIFADLIGYRADQFEKAGVDASKISTVEDFTDAMRKLKAFYGAANKNYYPLSGRDSAIRFAAWFGAASNISSTESNGVYLGHYKDGSFDIMSDGAYAMAQTMKTWYDEGLINPEWIAGTTSEADWEASMLNGNASIFYDYYNRSQWFMDNGGTKADPNYKMQVMNFLKDKDGKTMKVTTSLKYNDELVTAINAKASDASVKAALQFIDFFYSDEGITLANYGVEGESFKADNGAKQFIADYSKEESKAAGEKKWSFLSDRMTVCKPVDDAAFFKWNSPLISEAAGRLFVSDNLMTSYTLKLTENQSKELSNLVATVFDAEISGITSFINGKRTLSTGEWTKFQSEMNTMGLGKIEQIQLEAYQNTYGK